MCIEPAGSGGTAGDRDPSSGDRQDRLATGAGLRVPEELVVRGTEEAGLVPAVLHAAVEDVSAPHPEGRGIERLARLIVQHDGEAARGVALDRRHHPRRVLDDDVGLVLAELEARATIGQHGERPAEEAADGAVRDRLVVGVPAAVLPEADLAGADRGEAGARHQSSPAVSTRSVTGPSFTSASAMRAPKRPVATGTSLSRARA